METVISIGAEHVTYDDRLRRLMSDQYGVDVDDQEAFDPVSLLPAFVLSGASVDTDAHAHDDHAHVVGITVRVAPEMLDAFFATLPQVLVADEEDAD